MSTTYTDPRFRINEDGFGFKNTFENAIYFGPFGWSIRTGGRCGGMSYAALDFFYSTEFDRPDTNKTPPDGDVLADYILKRQLHTFKSVADEYIAAMMWPGGSDIYYGRCHPPNGDSFRFYRDEILRRKRPCNIACIAIGSGLPDIGDGHQVLGIGITDDPDPEKVLIHVYDSNDPGHERVLRLNERDGVWELRCFTDGSVGQTVHRTFKAWFPDPGYRKHQPDIFEKHSPHVDLSNRDLRNWKMPQKQDLQHYIFTRADFSGNDISSGDFGGDFEGVNAGYARFVGTRVRQCDFRNAELTGALFSNADLRGTTFDGSNMQRAALVNTELSDARLCEANLERAFFNGAKMNNTRLDGAELSDGLLAGLNAVNTRFDRATLEGCNLTGAALNNVSFVGADLDGAMLLGASLRDCNFKNAKLSRALLTGVPIANCDFSGADLTRANFKSAVLNTVDFCGTDLRRADFRGVSIDHLKLDFDVEYARSRWQGAVLHDVSGLHPGFFTHLIREGATIG